MDQFAETFPRVVLEQLQVGRSGDKGRRLEEGLLSIEQEKDQVGEREVSIAFLLPGEDLGEEGLRLGADDDAAHHENRL